MSAEQRGIIPGPLQEQVCPTWLSTCGPLSVLQMLGVPTPEVWPGYANLPHRIDFKPASGQPLQQVFQQVNRHRWHMQFLQSCMC